jgi:hypothetical protein
MKKQSAKDIENMLVTAFVQGMQWWEFHQEEATAWDEDRNEAEREAKKMLLNGTLGIKKLKNL